MKRLAHVTAITVFCAAPLCNGFWPLVVGFWLLMLLVFLADDDARFVENLGEIVFTEEVYWVVWKLTYRALDPKP